MTEVFVHVFVVIRVRIVPEGRPVFVAVDSLLVSTELVAKTLAGLIHLVSCREVAVVTEELSIEVIECLTVLGVINVTGLDALVEYDVCVVVPALNFCLLWSRCHFL